MNRHIVAGMLGLALAGCAQSRSAIPRNAIPPVGLTTYPTLNDEISRETKDPNNRLGGGRSSPPPGLADSTPPARDVTPEAESEASRPQMAVSPPTASDPTVAAASTVPPVEPDPGSPPPMTDLPATTTTAAAPETTMPAPATTASAPEATMPAPLEASPAPSVVPATVSAPPAPGPEAEPGPSTPSSEPVSALPSGPTEAPAAVPGESLPPLPPVGELPQLPPSVSEPSPAPMPAAMPEGMPTTEEAPAPAPPPATSPAAAPKPSAAAEPDVLPTIDLPPLPEEVAPASAPAPAPTTPPATGASASAWVLDPSVRPVAAKEESDPTQVRSEVRPRELGAAGKVAARVGDEIVTMHEVEVAFRERCRMMNIPPGERLSDDQKNMIATAVLNDLIERTMIIQEAKRKMKKPEQLKMLTDVADRVWREEELPPLLKRTTSANEYELKEKMAESGESYDDLREAFRQKFMAHGFLDHVLGDKMKVSKHEMLAYYNAHLADFDRPALVSWREVVVEVGKCPSQAEARKKADAILQRLTRGEDFATVAKAESDGPNKSEGGLWKTSPGSYNVESVNAALERLEIGQVSQIVEGPTSYHILLVESRRPAGPAPFYEHEVQDKVHRLVRNQKVQHVSDAYLTKLRKQTVITTVFDGTEYAPAAHETPDASRASR